MTVRKTYSDSKLVNLFKSKEEPDIDNLLPKFLMKDLREDSIAVNSSDEEMNYNKPVKTNHFTHSKQEVNDSNDKYKIKNKYGSSNDVRQFARDYKNQLYSKFQNSFTGKPSFSPKDDFNYREPSTHYGTYISQSPNDSQNLSLLDEFNNFLSLKPIPKRVNSNLDVKKIYKPKSSLFYNNEKDEKCDEFEDVQDLLNSINTDLWVYAMTQKGSRNLQKLLNKIVPEDLDVILEKIKFTFAELMCDIYGNYFCQKLIQCCSAEQRMFILKHILKDFAMISCNNSGTHSLQSLIEIINMPGEEDLVKEAVKDSILSLSYDINGTHVMQKVLSSIDESNREHINKTLLLNLDKLIYDSNGICVIKKFINANEDIKMKKQLLGHISKNALEIVQNPFGNYIIQHILDEWGSDTIKDVINVITTNIISLSMQKFSSNVVEKCFDLVDSQTKKKMIKELFNTTKISSLLKNKYGNFVLQKTIQVMNNDEKKEIKELLNKKISLTSNKEKIRLNSLFEII